MIHLQGTDPHLGKTNHLGARRLGPTIGRYPLNRGDNVKVKDQESNSDSIERLLS